MTIDEEQSFRDTATSSPVESNANEFDDWLGIPSDLVRNSADLSSHRGNHSSLTFEDIFATEEPLLTLPELYDNTFPVNEDVAMKAAVEDICTRAPTPAPQLMLMQTSINPPSQDELYGPKVATSQDGQIESKRRQSNATSTQESKKNMKPRKTRPVQTSIKRDLAVTEVNSVAQSLIQGESISFFINNYQLIYDDWLSSSIRAAFLNTDYSVDESIIAAFDVLHGLKSGKVSLRILLRFAYVQLIRAVDALRAAARKD
jgi:hypothetical protein